MKSKKGLAIINLGTPDSYKVSDVRRYLVEFLMDGRVIDIPILLRWFLVRGIIALFRAPRSAKAYKSIWTSEGSPLMVISKKTEKRMQELLPDIHVSLGMRYGNPSIENSIDQLKNKGVEDVLVLPMYPHYAMSSYETVVERVKRVVKKKKFRGMKFSYFPHFYQKPEYGDVLSNSINEYWSADKHDYLLFSYHGIPERHLRKTHPRKKHVTTLEPVPCIECKGDAKAVCYRRHCLETTEIVAQRLNLDKREYGTSFQSRLGFDPWVRPYTAARIKELAKMGVKKLAVVTPAFVADCLETIEEMGDEGKEIFIENGGEKFTLIPCLNIREDWMQVLKKWVENHFSLEDVKA